MWEGARLSGGAGGGVCVMAVQMLSVGPAANVWEGVEQGVGECETGCERVWSRVRSVWEEARMRGGTSRGRCVML